MGKRIMSKYTLIFFAAVLLISAGCIKTEKQIAPQELINRMREVYATAQSFSESSSGETVNHLEGGKKSVVKSEFYYQRPNRFRFVSKTERVTATAVCDGEYSYVYIDSMKEARRAPASENVSSFYTKMAGAGLINPSNIILEICLLDNLLPSDNIESSRVENSKVGNIDCYLLKLAYKTGEKQELWIGKSDYLIRRNQITVSEKTLASEKKDTAAAVVSDEQMDRVELNPVLDPKLFAADESVPLVDADASRQRNVSAKGVMKGEKAPDFTLFDEQGNKISLADFSGKTLVISFWDPMFRLCLEDLTDLQRVYEGTDREQLAVISLTEEKDESLRREFLGNLTPGFPMLYDPSGMVAKRYSVEVVPYTVVVDKNGIVAGELPGHQETGALEKMLETMQIHIK